MTTPPRLASRLVELVVRDERWRETLLGDLAEEFDSVAHARTVAAARRWYWRQTMVVIRQSLTQSVAALFEPTGDRLTGSVVKEVRYGWRAIRRRPAVTLVIVVTLALGLGANAATFGMVDALIGHPFPARDVSRLVMLSEDRTGDTLGYARESVSPANFYDWNADPDRLPHLTAFVPWDVNLAGGSEPERVRGQRVTADFFSALGITPALGRALGTSDEVWGHHHQAVIGDGIWRRRFAADPAVLGRTIELDGEPYDIVGVAPRDFDMPFGTEVWAPLALAPAAASNRVSHYLTVIAALPAGRTMADVQARMSVVYAGQRDRDPDANRGRAIVVRTFADGMRDPGLPRVMALQRIAGLIVLLVGCANIANLLLACTADRQQELAVRLAIGASRAQIVRQLLIESLLLALLSVPAALAAGMAIVYFIRASLPASLLPLVPGWRHMSLDARAIGLTVVSALGAALVFGLAPAWSSTRVKLGATLKAGGRSATSSRSRSRLRRALVVAEVALTLPLLIAAGLAALAGERFANGAQGYNPDGVIQLRTALSDTQYPTADAQRAFGNRILDETTRLAGVESAAIASTLPATSISDERTLVIDGRPIDRERPLAVSYRAVSPGYFETMQIPIEQGRGFSTADRENRDPVAVVSASFAREYFGAASPLGHRIATGDGAQDWITIVGVSGDTIDDWLLARGRPTVLVPISQFPTGSINLVARVRGAPEAFGGGLRRALANVDRGQPAFGVMTMRQALRDRTAGLRIIAQFMAGFGLLTLVLSTFGIYGVMANFVAERRYEIGLRMALGATAGHVFRQVVGQGGRLAGVGLVVGLASGIALARLMNGALFGIVAVEPPLLILATLALGAAAVAATVAPARRAMRTQPIEALRGD